MTTKLKLGMELLAMYHSTHIIKLFYYFSGCYFIKRKTLLTIIITF